MHTLQEMTRRKGVEERQLRPSSCVGCGGAADGYNYDAPSCFSCKTFFRRTVVSKQVFTRCLTNGLCARDETAKQCRACRFKKCIKGGMNASVIYNNNSKNCKPELQQSTATSSDEPCSSNSTDNASPTDLGIKGNSLSIVMKTGRTTNTELRIVNNPFRFECKVNALLKSLLSIEAAHQKLRTSSYTPKMLGDISIDAFVDGPSKLGNHFGVMCAQPSNPFPIPVFPFEMVIKYRQRLDFSGFDYCAQKLWFFQDLVYTVEYMKSLPIYHLLDDASKRALLSSALTCSNLTTAFYSYSHRSDRTFYPDGGTMTWTSEQLGQAPGTVRLYSGIIAAMKLADLNAHEYALLKMIIVCNPMLDGICPLDATLLGHEKERCTKALLSYVLSRRGVDQGPAFFSKIISIANVAVEITAWEKGQHVLATAMGLYEGSMTPFGEAIFHSH